MPSVQPPALPTELPRNIVNLVSVHPTTSDLGLILKISHDLWLLFLSNTILDGQDDEVHFASSMYSIQNYALPASLGDLWK